MNTILKKALLLLLVFTLSLSTCACGKNMGDLAAESPSMDPQGAIGDTQSSGEIMWVSQTKEYYPFGVACAVNSVIRLGSSLLMAGARDGAPLLGLADFEVESDGELSMSDTRSLDLDEPGAVDEAKIYGIAAGGDGYFYVLTGEMPAVYIKNGEMITNTDYQGRYSILKYSDNGAFLERMKITDWQGADVGGMAVGSNGEIVIYGYSYVSVLHWNEDVVHTEPVSDDSFVLSAALCGKGIIVSTFASSGTEARYYLVDGAVGTLSELAVIHPDDRSGVEFGNWSVTQGIGDEYIVSGNSKFFTLDLDTGASEELFQWRHAQDGIDDCAYVCRVAESTFVCAVKGSECLFVTGKVAKPYQERSVVKVALYGMEDPVEAEGKLAELNASSSEYTYECESYTVDELDRLLADISSQNTPDLLLFNNNLDTSSDYFDDLYPYIDSDSELSRDSFIPNLLDALSVNGQLHEMWTGVEICTLAARTADVGNTMEHTPADYNKMVASGKYLSVFQSFMSKENLLKWVADIGVSIYVDRDSGTCSFDSGSFSEILAWCKDMGNDIIEGSENSVSYNMSEVVLSVETISDPERVRIIYENFGEPYTFVGFPLGENDGNYYTCADGGCMAIPKLSGNKEGAWEYIRSQLETSTQLKTLYYLPVNYEAFQRLAASKLDDEESALLIDLFSNTTAARIYSDEPLREIILSYGNAYLAGDKSIEETVALIQSSASMYMSEHYG